MVLQYVCALLGWQIKRKYHVKLTKKSTAGTRHQLQLQQQTVQHSSRTQRKKKKHRKKETSTETKVNPA